MEVRILSTFYFSDSRSFCLELMKSINDLKIIDFDYLIAKDDQVALRYSAEGSHSGEPYKGIQPTGRKAKWTAAALFKLNNEGKITL
jgi:predicted ester cyclase